MSHFAHSDCLILLARQHPDSVSNVVDENGEPLVVWHGSRWNPLEEAPGDAVFGKSKTPSQGTYLTGRQGFFFANEAVAENYQGGSLGTLTAYFINARNPYMVDVREELRELDYDIETEREEAEAAGYPIGRWLGEGNVSFEANDSATAYLDDNMHEIMDRADESKSDAVLVRGADGSFVIVAFAPTQIKSATDNTGAFDGGNPDIRYLRDPKDKKVVGTWNRKTNELTLFRGANASTLVHELGGHAAYQFAQEQAAQGDKTLLNKMNECIDYALTNPKMKPLIDDIRSRYPEASEEVMRDEIFAALMERNSPVMQNLTKTLQGKAWYNRAWQAIKDAFRAMLTKIGFNKADLSGIDKMQPEEFISWLDRTMAEGRTLGRLKHGGANGIRDMAKVGVRTDGVEVYMSDANVRNLPFAERIKMFRDIMSKDYAGRTARFTKNGNVYYATFDKGDIQKNIYGDKKSDAAGREAKVNAGASGDMFDLVENARYDKSKPESGKNIKSHKGVKQWDYFDKTVEIDGRPFDVVINVRDKGNNQYVYVVQLRVNNKLRAGGQPLSLQNQGSANVMSGASGPTRNSIAGSVDGRKVVSAADPVTYDDAGNVIPLSQRFNPAKNDIRYNTTSQGVDASNDFLDDVRSTKEKLEEKLVDSTAPIKSVQKEIDNHARANGNEGVEEVVNADGSTDWRNSTDFVAAKDKENGHLERNIRELKTRYIDPATEALAKAILPNQDKADLITDFNLYLQCKHAAARNRKIANDRGDTYTADYSEGMGMVTLPNGRRVGLSENVANQLLATMGTMKGQSLLIQ